MADRNTNTPATQGASQQLDTFKYEFKIKPTEHNNYFVSSLMFHMNTKPYYRQCIIEGYSK